MTLEEFLASVTGTECAMRTAWRLDLPWSSLPFYGFGATVEAAAEEVYHRVRKMEAARGYKIFPEGENR